MSLLDVQQNYLMWPSGFITRTFITRTLVRTHLRTLMLSSILSLISLPISLYISFLMILCPSSYANLSSDEINSKLDQALIGYEPKKPIQSRDDRAQTIRDVSGMIRFKAPKMNLGSEFSKWMWVLTSLYENSSLPEPKRQPGESDEEFNQMQVRHSDQVALRETLVHYLKTKFPIQPAIASLQRTAFHQSVTESQVHEELRQAPQIYAALLFTELLHSKVYEGWQVHVEGLQNLRGNSESGDGSGDKLMAALADSIIGQTPIYPVNSNPVPLTQSSASQSFFKGLPDSLLREKSGIWEGYRFDFDRSALIETGIYFDTSVKQPIPFFLMREVKLKDAVFLRSVDREFRTLERAAKETRRNYDLFQAALSLSQHPFWNFSVTEVIDEYLMHHQNIRRKKKQVDFETSYLSQEYRIKIQEHERRKNIKTEVLMKQYFPNGSESITDIRERNRRQGALNADLSAFMKPSSLDIEIVKENLTQLRAARISRRLPQRNLVENATYLLEVLADQGMARAQYELAKLIRDRKELSLNIEKGKHYASLAHSQGLPLLSFEPEEKVTTTGAVYTSVIRHPKLGRAWKDPRSLLWSDQVVKDEWGQVKTMNWQDANQYCLSLNSETTIREEVKRHLIDREAHLAPLRKAYYDLPAELRTVEASKLIRDASKAAGPVPGCYLPSKEEHEELGADMGYGQSLYTPQIFSDFGTGLFWTGSTYQGFESGAFDFDSTFGFVDFESKNIVKSVRCCCSER